MEELEQARCELELVMKGKMKADDACVMVQNWLQLTCYDLAHGVSNHTTKQGRATALESVKESAPEFYDDVKTMAKIIFKAGQTTKHK